MLILAAAAGLAGLYALGKSHGCDLVSDDEVDRLSHDDLETNFWAITGKSPPRDDDAFLRRIIKHEIQQQGITSLL